MRLVDLDPRWIERDGKRVGFAFISPVQRVRSDGTYNPTPYRLSCFSVPLHMHEQEELLEKTLGTDLNKFALLCRDNYAWTVINGIETATFETMTVLPSVDASGAGLWHGFIKNGNIE